MPSASAQRRYALVATTPAPVLTPFIGSAVNVALPRISAEFGTNAVVLGWVATAYILVAAIGLVPLGRLADLPGQKRVFVWGVALFILGSSLLSAKTGVALVCAGLAGPGASFRLGLYWQYTRGLDVRMTGLVLQSLVSPRPRRMSDKVEPRIASLARGQLREAGARTSGQEQA